MARICIERVDFHSPEVHDHPLFDVVCWSPQASWVHHVFADHDGALDFAAGVTSPATRVQIRVL